MKIRNDFVSNSSSSSYVLSTKKTPLQLSKYFDDDNICDYLENYVAMTIKSLLWKPKKNNPQGEYWHGIGRHLCIPRNRLHEYFDENGNVRSDLDIHKVCRGEFSMRYTSDHDENVVCGKVTKETITFGKWLYEQMTLHKDTSIWAMSKEYMVFLNRMENEIKKKDIYVVRCCYSGLPDLKGNIMMGEGRMIWPRLQKAGFDYCYDDIEC